MPRITEEELDRIGEETAEKVNALAATVGCLSEEQVSYLAGVKGTTLLAWRKRGIGPAWTRLGNQVLYPKAALSEFLERQARESAKEQSAAVSL